MYTSDIALAAIAEAMKILYTLADRDHNKEWTTASTHIANLDKLAQALGFPSALAVQERVEGDREHATAKHRDAGW